MIVVTGATGQLGRGVIDGLLRRVPAERIVASVRDPAKATFADRGVEVRAGDFGKSDELAKAFAGARQVLIISVNEIGETGRRLHRAAIEAARAAGVRRVLYTGHDGSNAGSVFGNHVDAEVALAESGLPFTSLRHGFYAESALHFVGRGFEHGEIRAPEDGPVNWTARADLAEADAAVLAEDGRLDGLTPPLTAREAFTLADLAAIASADLLLGAYRCARQGDFAAIDPTLETLLGRPAQTMRDFLGAVLKPAGGV